MHAIRNFRAVAALAGLIALPPTAQAPVYRCQRYTVVNDEVVLVEPATRKVVEVID
jgi:hypothetical protein